GDFWRKRWRAGMGRRNGREVGHRGRMGRRVRAWRMGSWVHGRVNARAGKMARGGCAAGRLFSACPSRSAKCKTSTIARSSRKIHADQETESSESAERFVGRGAGGAGQK